MAAEHRAGGRSSGSTARLTRYAPSLPSFGARNAEAADFETVGEPFEHALGSPADGLEETERHALRYVSPREISETA
jgi:hypothetical protein